MTARRLGILVAAATMAGSGAYVVVYTYRWEWNRAMFAALVFLIAEIGTIGAYLAARFSRLEQEAAASPGRRADPDPVVLARLRQNAPPHAPFAWLDPAVNRVSVFITILLSTGVVVSAAAWLIQRLAARTTTPQLESRLARQLAVFDIPPGQLVVDESELLADDDVYERNDALRFLVVPGAQRTDNRGRGSGARR